VQLSGVPRALILPDATDDADMHWTARTGRLASVKTADAPSPIPHLRRDRSTAGVASGVGFSCGDSGTVGVDMANLVSVDWCDHLSSKTRASRSTPRHKPMNDKAFAERRRGLPKRL
jgi:hypothetical protein